MSPNPYKRKKKVTERLPTVAEINVFDSLDERSAVKRFHGKTVEQAQELFRKNFLYYQEDLGNMGPAAFCFYVRAAIGYVNSPESDGDSDAASSFCHMLKFVLDHRAEEVVNAFPVIHKAIVDILENFDRFHCDPAIYGDVAEEYRTLLLRLGS